MGSPRERRVAMVYLDETSMKPLLHLCTAFASVAAAASGAASPVPADSPAPRPPQANAICNLQIDGFGQSPSAGESVTVTTDLFGGTPVPTIRPLTVLSRNNSASVAALFNRPNGTLQVSPSGASLMFGGVVVATATFPGGIRSGTALPAVALALNDTGLRNYKMASTSRLSCNLPWDTVASTPSPPPPSPPPPPPPPPPIPSLLGCRGSADPVNRLKYRSANLDMHLSDSETLETVRQSPAVVIPGLEWKWAGTKWPLTASLTQNGVTLTTWNVDSSLAVSSPAQFQANGTGWRILRLSCHSW